VPEARDHEGVVTTTFTEQAGKTTVRTVVRYDSQATRDIVLGSGMEHGVASGYDRIDEMLEAQVKKAS
jgi:uncharacterized protein YndB with AHSA1/START domain